MRKIIFFCGVLLSQFAFAAENGEPKWLAISAHYTALPTLYRMDAIPIERMGDKITRQYIMGAESMLVKWTFKKGAVVPLQTHASEQITWITQGSVKVISQGKTFVMKAGDVMIIPAHVPHEFLALEDTIDIDFFAPIREDWLKQIENKQIPAPQNVVRWDLPVIETTPADSSHEPVGVAGRRG